MDRAEGLDVRRALVWRGAPQRLGGAGLPVPVEPRRRSRCRAHLYLALGKSRDRALRKPPVPHRVLSALHLGTRGAFGSAYERSLRRLPEPAFRGIAYCRLGACYLRWLAARLPGRPIVGVVGPIDSVGCCPHSEPASLPRTL